MTRRLSRNGRAALVLGAAAGMLIPVAQAVTAEAAPAAPAAAAHGRPAPGGQPAKATAHASGARKALASGCWYSGSHWWCNNRSGAPVVDYNGNLVGYMYSNPSWFSFRCEGGRNNNGPHPNRWEYTQADNGRWGYMGDGDIASETDPLPDVGSC